jgi:hypothetical protein
VGDLISSLIGIAAFCYYNGKERIAKIEREGEGLVIGESEQE